MTYTQYSTQISNFFKHHILFCYFSKRERQKFYHQKTLAFPQVFFLQNTSDYTCIRILPHNTDSPIAFLFFHIISTHIIAIHLHLPMLFQRFIYLCISCISFPILLPILSFSFSTSSQYWLSF